MILLSALLAIGLQEPPVRQADDESARAAAETLFYGDDIRPSTDDNDTCRRDGNTLQMNACVMEDLEAEEARMQRYLDLALRRAAEMDADSGEYGEPTRQVEFLNRAQVAWEIYAEARCEGQWDEVKDGTIRTIVWVSCRIEATRQRTHDIWSDHLTYWDSTPPLLPEPVRTVLEEQAGPEGP